MGDRPQRVDADEVRGAQRDDHPLQGGERRRHRGERLALSSREALGEWVAGEWLGEHAVHDKFEVPDAELSELGRGSRRLAERPALRAADQHHQGLPGVRQRVHGGSVLGALGLQAR